MLARQRRASLTDAHRESNNIARWTRRAARVEGQPLEERIVTLQRDMERVVHRRACSTMDQRIMALRTNQASHTARWATSEDQRATFTNLPKGRRPFNGKDERLLHQMGRMDIRCAHCDVLHWIEERNTSSPRTRPNFTACCSCGKVSLPPLAQPPSPLWDLLEGQTPEAKQFRNQIRKYNNAFAFTSVGAKIDQSMARGGVYTFRLQGELHHHMGSLLPREGETKICTDVYS